MSVSKVALITGAGKGLGKETARALANKGFVVILAGRNVESLEALASVIEKEGGQARSLLLDVNQSSTHATAASSVEKWYGKLDLLINNAGVMLEGSWQGNTSSTVTQEILRRTFDTNFFGQISVTQAFIPLLEKGTSAQIINMGSYMGSLTVHAQPEGPLADYKPFAYDASKTALNAFTVHLAAALKAKGIRVNTAHPGHVKTDLGGSYAPMEIDEGIQTVLNMATSQNTSETGQFIHAGNSIPW